jgi:hypothetical protein
MSEIAHLAVYDTNFPATIGRLDFLNQSVISDLSPSNHANTTEQHDVLERIWDKDPVSLQAMLERNFDDPENCEHTLASLPDFELERLRNEAEIRLHDSYDAMSNFVDNTVHLCNNIIEGRDTKPLVELRKCLRRILPVPPDTQDFIQEHLTPTVKSEAAQVLDEESQLLGTRGYRHLLAVYGRLQHETNRRFYSNYSLENPLPLHDGIPPLDEENEIYGDDHGLIASFPFDPELHAISRNGNEEKQTRERRLEDVKFYNKREKFYAAQQLGAFQSIDEDSWGIGRQDQHLVREALKMQSSPTIVASSPPGDLLTAYHIETAADEATLYYQTMMYDKQFSNDFPPRCVLLLSDQIDPAKRVPHDVFIQLDANARFQYDVHRLAQEDAANPYTKEQIIQSLQSTPCSFPGAL